MRGFADQRLLNAKDLNDPRNRRVAEVVRFKPRDERQRPGLLQRETAGAPAVAEPGSVTVSAKEPAYHSGCREGRHRYRREDHAGGGI
jgi:hypothetical protein